MGQWHGETTFPLPSNWLDRLPRWIKYHKERDSPIQRKEMHIKGSFLMHICYPYPKSRSSSCNCIHHRCPPAKILTVFLRKIVITHFKKQYNTFFGTDKLKEVWQYYKIARQRSKVKRKFHCIHRRKVIFECGNGILLP